MKDVLASAGVPTARYRAFGAGDEDAAFAFLETLPGLYVVKTDGLAAGKGVIVTESIADARDAVRAYLSGAAFGDAGPHVRDRGGLARARGLAVRALRRPRRVPDRARAGSQARVRRRRRARTRAAWARTRRSRSSRRRRRRRDDGEGGPPDARRAAPPRRRVPRVPVLRAHAHPGRARRCSSTTCASATRSARCSCPRLASDLFVHCRESATGRIETDVELADVACVGVALAAEGYPPAPIRTGDVIDGLDARGRARGRHGVPRRHDGGRRRAGRDQRRSRAHRHRGRLRPRRGARPRLRGRGPDLVARRPLPSRHRRPGPPVIPRYSLPEIAALFTDEARFGAWLEVEVLAVEAWAQLGVVPAEARARGARARRLRRRRDPRAREGHRSRRRRVRRRRAGERRASPRARGCTTGSRRATSSTPRSRSR